LEEAETTLEMGAGVGEGGAGRAGHFLTYTQPSAAVALPAYQDYTIRARVSEGILATSQCRTAVAEIYQTAAASTTIGANNWGCGEGTSAPTQYVAAINTNADGKVTVTLATTSTLGAASGTALTLTPTTSSGTALTVASIPTQVGGFKCARLTIPSKYLPGSCR